MYIYIYICVLMRACKALGGLLGVRPLGLNILPGSIVFVALQHTSSVKQQKTTTNHREAFVFCCFFGLFLCFCVFCVFCCVLCLFCFYKVEHLNESLNDVSNQCPHVCVWRLYVCVASLPPKEPTTKGQHTHVKIHKTTWCMYFGHRNRYYK